MPDQKGGVITTFTPSNDLQGAEFVDANLRGARFVESDLSAVVMRGVQVEGADIDAPFLFDGESSLRVNGVDVIPLVETELNPAFPAVPTGAPQIRMACARPGLRSSAHGRARSSASRRCRLAQSTPRWAASGRSRRRCGTWS
jgi:Pentapeptide repeats (8 copies)